MVKKRVHEIAKDLGYQNRDLIEKLQKLGFEVKSHSSTVDEDDVRRALRKDDDERKARTEEKRVSTHVIRRRPKDGAPAPVVVRRGGDDGATPHVLELPVIDLSMPPADLEYEEHEPEAEIEDAPWAEEDTPALETVAEVSSPVELPGEAAPAPEPVRAPEVVVTPAEVEVVAEVREPAPAVVVESPVASTEAAPADEDEAETRRERREARMARPDHRKREEVVDEDDEKPELSMEDLGISELDFAAADKERDAKESRVAPPPPSTKPVMQQEEPTTKVVRRIDPAVLKARLATAKRPEPPKDWGKPDTVAASPVTELVVRTDASGKRRELVDVRKEAAKGKSRVGQKRREEMSAKDLLEHRRGQVYYPTPTRRRLKSKVKGRRLESTGSLNKKPIEIGETITVADLARQLGVKGTEVLTWLIRHSVRVPHVNAPITHEVALSVVADYGYEVESLVFDEESRLAGSSDEDTLELEDPDAVSRAPVVTVMGHVDHGKTSLLDRIRKTNVAAGEAGGITQAIAGYQVGTSRGLVTFLDTPGHKAFTAMRARGADVTDIVVLVVAADDGVMPQTLEAIEHARQAEVPIIVALNKVDKPDANPERVLQQLAGYGIQVEEWGGEVLCVRVSAKTGLGVENLLEQIALQAEIMELKANPTLPAVGRVIEAEISKGRGPVATVLIQHGTLSVGDAVIAGEAIGRVRAMLDDQGKRITEAGPSTPVQILGLDGVPQPGDEMRVAHSLDDARELSAHRRALRREQELAGQAKVSLQDLFARMSQGAQKELKIIIKADVQGSVEALRAALEGLTTPKVRVHVIHGGVGGVVESDVEFARASEAIIVGFGVRPDTAALKAARALGGVDIRTHNIIYECVDEVRLAMAGLLAPITREKYLGRAEIRQTFTVPKIGTVAGSAVVDGVVARSANIRVLRDSKMIYEGRLSSLKRFKDDVREVKEGFECGMGVEKFNDLKIGDIIEAYEIEQIAAVLDEPTSASSAEARI